MKVLNLYAGIGGNRKLWQDVEVTAVEKNEDIAKEYQKNFKNDRVIVGDAHRFLLLNYDKFDFIWSSPPCPTHSDIRRCGVQKGQYKAKYPEMDLYQQIILLRNFAPKKTKWVIENVIPYYKPLIAPTKELGRHYYWSNFRMSNFEKEDNRRHNKISAAKPVYGFDISESNIRDKRKVLRNLVNPELGLHIFNCAKGMYYDKKEKQTRIEF